MVHVAELQVETEAFPEGSAIARELGFRTILAVPLLREGTPLGAIVLRRAKVELSGGITLENVRAYAETGADFVSCGAITHSARAMDISFRLELA